MTNSLKKPVVVDRLPKATAVRGPKSTYIFADAIELAAEHKNQWVHCYAFTSENADERRNKANAMRTAGNNFCTKTNKESQFNYWQSKVITVENTVNLYILCENREGTYWQ